VTSGGDNENLYQHPQNLVGNADVSGPDTEDERSQKRNKFCLLEVK
jgi:hypothetical protein